MLTVKLPRLAGWLERRRAVAARYRTPWHPALAFSFLRLAQRVTAGISSWFGCQRAMPIGCLRRQLRPCPASAEHGLPEGRCRNWLQSDLRERGVNTIIYYPIPIHRQPAYADLGYAPGSLDHRATGR